MAATECKTYFSNMHIPKRTYQGSARNDLYAAETKDKTRFSYCYYCGQIVRPSGFANTRGIIVHNETVDSDY